jgi:exodeoxyribonuclease VII large subunit
MLFDDVRYFTVSEVNAQVRTLLEETYPDVCVLGEVSNFKSHTSGHLYFTLKDSESQLRAVCFRRDASRIGFDLEDGMKVLARGRLTVYEGYGQYQMVAHAIEAYGTGELELAFRKLKERLDKEGLFDPEHKRSLPVYPKRIAVVTSPTGAAIRDIISTLRRRWPALDVLLCPVRVQGEQAAAEIAHALELLPKVDDVDLIIVGRGGGSLEDLWAFNEEPVARAIYECPIPIISAVGHETDFTIADFVADARAATPTMAAEMAVPLGDDVLAGIDQNMNRLMLQVNSRLNIHKGRLRELVRSYALGRVRSQIEHAMQRHDMKMERLRDRVVEVIRDRRGRLAETLARLDGLDARAILERGYTLCSDYKTGRIIRSASGAFEARSVQITFHDGDVLTEVKEKIHERRQG